MKALATPDVTTNQVLGLVHEYVLPKSTVFTGSSVATIQFHREYQLEQGDKEAQALACASVRSVRSLG